MPTRQHSHPGLPSLLHSLQWEVTLPLLPWGLSELVHTQSTWAWGRCSVSLFLCSWRPQAEVVSIPRLAGAERLSVPKLIAIFHIWKPEPGIFITCSEALTIKGGWGQQWTGLSNIYLKVTCNFPPKRQAAGNISKSSGCPLTATVQHRMAARNQWSCRDVYPGERSLTPARNASSSQLGPAGPAHVRLRQVWPKFFTKDPPPPSTHENHGGGWRVFASPTEGLILWVENGPPTPHCYQPFQGNCSHCKWSHTERIYLPVTVDILELINRVEFILCRIASRFFFLLRVKMIVVKINAWHFLTNIFRFDKAIRVCKITVYNII